MGQGLMPGGVVWVAVGKGFLAGLVGPIPHGLPMGNPGLRRLWGLAGVPSLGFVCPLTGAGVAGCRAVLPLS